MTERRCTVDGCENPGPLRRGWCDKHYARWWKHGDPTVVLIGNPQHGTYNMYANHGCRCDDCRAANTTYCRERQHARGAVRPAAVVFAERRAAAIARDNHGTESRYRLGCRCGACRAAASSARRGRRARATA